MNKVTNVQVRELIEQDLRCSEHSESVMKHAPSPKLPAKGGRERNLRIRF